MYFLEIPAVRSGTVMVNNPAQGLRAALGAASYAVSPPPNGAGRGPAWRLRLTLRGIGRGGKIHFRPVTTPVLTLRENTACYRHGAAFVVDYENTSAGLRQNYTLRQRPGGPFGPVQVLLAVRTGLRVTAERDGQALRLRQGGREMIRYADLRAWDATGQALPARMRLSQGGQALALIVDDKRATYPVTIDPLVSNLPTAILADPSNAGTAYGTTVAGVGDVNRDGFADVLVGAGQTNSNEGRAYLYYGSASGLLTNAPVSLINPAPTIAKYFGDQVAAAGDVNGDGFADVLVSANGPRLGQLPGEGQGRVYLYRGSVTGLLLNSPQILNAPPTPVFLTFGSGVSGAGDVNRDGFADVLVSDEGGFNTAGHVYFFRGSTTGLVSTPTVLTEPGSLPGNYYGGSVAGAGDVNGDGFADVLVGARGTGNNAGRAYYYRGSAAGLATAPLTLTDPNPPSEYFGTAVAGAGDVNGDGFADVLIGVRFVPPTNAGRTYFYRGSSSGLSTAPMALMAPPQNPAPASTRDLFCRFSGVGDVNRDGFADFVIGALGYQNNGRAFLYRGSAAGFVPVPIVLTEPGTASGRFFGWSLSGAGDVNGDGYSDILVTASAGISSSIPGRAYLFHGGADFVLSARASNTTATPFAVYPTLAIGHKVYYRYTGSALVGTVEVLNPLGQVVYACPVKGAAEGTVSLHGLPPGVYVVRYRTGTAWYSSRCIVN